MQNEPDALQICVRCGYDLRGTQVESPCPECGILAGRSRDEGLDLWKARPWWLRVVSVGIYLMLLSMPLTVSWGLFVDPLQRMLRRKLDLLLSKISFLAVELVEHFRILGFDVAALLLLIGVRLATIKERKPTIDRHHARLRRWTRVAGFLPLSGLALMHGMMSLPYRRFFTPYSRWRESMGLLLLPYAAAALILIGGIALSILLMLDLRTIARRVGHASIAEHCTIVGVGMAGTLVLIPVVIAIASISSERFLSYSTTWLLIATLISTSGALFAFWWMYLMLRFAALFRKVAKQCRNWWAEADLAARAG